LLKEGPHSTLKEDEFFDAMDQSLDRIYRETDDFQRTVSRFSFSTFIIHSKSTVSILKIRRKCIKLCARKNRQKNENKISFALDISPIIHMNSLNDAKKNVVYYISFFVVVVFFNQYYYIIVQNDDVSQMVSLYVQ
jgi:hypothetical protein